MRLQFSSKAYDQCLSKRSRAGTTTSVDQKRFQWEMQGGGVHLIELVHVGQAFSQLAFNPQTEGLET